ncbi:MAG: sigma-70 family RNA polymerase sigma factor [Rhodoferax sp.]|nr:sigma-70 family RNA polymerase sigma factor [Rhodoferax sp.]
MLSYQNGDLGAFEELYRRHSKGLYVFISWRSPRKEWVDEITQDSWANLHQSRERYLPEAGFKTFLFQIARNRLIDLVRQDKPVLLASDLGVNECGDLYFDCLSVAQPGNPSPEVTLAKKQRVEQLHAAIRALPDDQKESLILQQFSGLSLEEIATLVQVPVETIKSRLRYAMRKLRQQLDDSTAPQEMG